MFIYLLAMYPMQTLIVTLFILAIYLSISRMNDGRFESLSSVNIYKESSRRESLEKARLYISPYTDIWRNLRLSNRFCSVRLQTDGKTIVIKELESPYRKSTVFANKNISPLDINFDMFNSICTIFDSNTHMDSIINLCTSFNCEIITEKPNSQKQTLLNINEKISGYNVNNNNDFYEQEAKKEKRELLDVNNASEVELTALPGISIVLAKKIVKRREEIGGFKDVNDFLQFTKLKPHMREQIKDLICAKKMKGSIKISRYNERNIDI